jgi:hypothetical protein
MRDSGSQKALGTLDSDNSLRSSVGLLPVVLKSSGFVEWAAGSTGRRIPWRFRRHAITLPFSPPGPGRSADGNGVTKWSLFENQSSPRGKSYYPVGRHAGRDDRRPVRRPCSHARTPRPDSARRAGAGVLAYLGVLLFDDLLFGGIGACSSGSARCSISRTSPDGPRTAQLPV